MRTDLKTDGDTAVIGLTGRFDFHGHRDFKGCCEAALEAPAIRRINVDLRAVEYLDSSALGMLLLLKERADARALQVSLLSSAGIVREILEVANFGVMFEMA